MVEDVENICPPLEIEMLTNLKLSSQREIKLCEREATKNIPSQGSLTTGRRRAERPFTADASLIRSVIKDLAARVLRSIQIKRYARNEIWPNALSQSINNPRSGRQVYWAGGLRIEDRIQAPPTENSACQTIPLGLGRSKVSATAAWCRMSKSDDERTSALPDTKSTDESSIE